MCQKMLNLLMGVFVKQHPRMTGRQNKVVCSGWQFGFKNINRTIVLTLLIFEDVFCVVIKNCLSKPMGFVARNHTKHRVSGGWWTSAVKTVVISITKQKGANAFGIMSTSASQMGCAKRDDLVNGDGVGLGKIVVEKLANHQPAQAMSNQMHFGKIERLNKLV